MATERREHARYEPVSATDVLLLWQDDGGRHQRSCRLGDISEGGCAFVSDALPPIDAHGLVRIPLTGAGVWVSFNCRILCRNPHGNLFLISVRFERPGEQQIDQLRAVLASAAYRPVQVETVATRMKYWRVPQWSAFLAAQQMPVMPRTKRALAALEAEKGEELSTDELAALAQGDPFLCLSLLREAEHRRSARLGTETSTPLAAVMQIGAAVFRELLLTSPETDETNPGLSDCEARAVLAGRLATAWSNLRADASPDEVALAALLAEIGELMLWHFAPELPRAALDALAAGRAKRSAVAQEMTCGFKFHDLTLRCAELWNLPAILTQLIRGHDTARANLARVCGDTARHLLADPANPALPDDLAAAGRLVPNASLEELAEAMTRLQAERAAAVATTAAPPP